MKGLRIICLLIILAVALSLGCSMHRDNPVGVNPDQGPDLTRLPDGDGHALMGIYTIKVDIESETVEAIRNRKAEPHWDVTNWLFPPNCPDCFGIKIINYDPVSKIVNLRIILKNPTNQTGNDVRGIILDFGNMTLLNPDSYTKLFGPGSINPFIAWIPNPDRTFPPFQVNSEDISIHAPTFPFFPPFTYVIEASWPKHCKEPYEVHPYNVSGDLKSDGSNSVLVNCAVHDWQGNLESVTIDLTPLGGAYGVPMDFLGVNMWQKEISYTSGPGEGYYDLLITATTTDTVAYNQTYNYAIVHVIGPGTDFPVDFGDEERVSFTPGASFMWPKHAMAVDSEGLPHVVWADNDPDPFSHLFKLYYSYRNASGVWQTHQTVGGDEVDAVYATMCIDDDDVVHIIWEDQRPGQLATDIYYTNSDSGFSDEVRLTYADPMVRHAFPRCVVDGGLMHIVWHDNRNDPDFQDYDVYYMTFDPDTGTPGAELVVEAQTGIYEGFPSIDIDVDGDVHVAYQQLNTIMQIYHKKKTDGSFGDAHIIAETDAYQPALHCGNNPNDVLVAFFDYSDGTFCDVYIGWSNDGGMSFDAGKVSTEADEYQVHPDVIQAQNGNIYVVWAEEGYIDEDGEPGPDDLNGDEVIDQNDAVPHRIYFRQRMGLAWQMPRILTEDEEAAAFPQIAEGFDKFVHVAYMKWTEDDPYDNYEIYYRRSLPWE